MEDYSRYGTATIELPKFELDDIHLPPANGPDRPQQPTGPAKEDEIAAAAASQTSTPWYDPRGWPVTAKLVLGTCIAGVIALVIVGAVVGASNERNRYPDYAPVNYTLVETYAGKRFFEGFGYFSDEDPTGGFVKYVNQSTAQRLNLTYASDASAVLKVDTVTERALDGRQSVRIHSRKTWDAGLFVFDVIHAPYGCATWPALWLTDETNWPLNGEIDVIEGVNNGTDGNTVTLHSAKGCTMDVKRKQTGTPTNAKCDNSTNTGCPVQGGKWTYGEELNRNGGGIYALDLRPEGIRSWFFPRAAIPTDIANSSLTPDPSAWPTPLADFPNTHCDISHHFRNQSIIANIDLCGELAAQPALYRQLSRCPASCEAFVRDHPEAFRQAYWEFGSFRVYQG